MPPQERESERESSPLSGLHKCHISTFLNFFFICGADEDTLAGVKEFGLFVSH